VAVIEGWDDANIGAAMASFDAKYDLPPADISTIHPRHAFFGLCRAGAGGGPARPA
jgi:hypothetical protein